MIWWPFSKTYKVKCPDGTTRIVYKDIDHAFPLAIKTVGTKGSIDVDAMREASASLSGTYASKIEGLLFELDSKNNSLMIQFRALYVSFQSHPCRNHESFDKQIQDLILYQSHLTELGVKIRGLIDLASSNPGDPQIIPTYQNLASAIGGKALIGAASSEIAEVRELAQDWAQSSD